jgi:hypothetical protein
MASKDRPKEIKKKKPKKQPVPKEAAPRERYVPPAPPRDREHVEG